MYSAVPKKVVMHILESNIHIPGITIVCLLVHCWLGKWRIQSFQGQKKSCKLQWASSGAMLVTRYPIMHTLVCCVCVCARMLTKEHICYTNSCVLIYRLCQIWCILSIQNKSVKIHDDHAMIIFVIFIYFKIIITCQINLFVTITITNKHTHTHTCTPTLTLKLY